MTEQLDLPIPQATCPFDHHAAGLRGPEKYEVYAQLRERRVQRSDRYRSRPTSQPVGCRRSMSTRCEDASGAAT